VCVFVHTSINSKTNDPKVFKHGIGNDLGVAYTDGMILWSGERGLEIGLDGVSLHSIE